jgi:hypothetical protein
MESKNKINYFTAIICAIVAIIIFCAIAVIFNVMPLNSLPVSFLGATLGALIGALITLVLLRGQTDIEEKKGKDIRILERKTEVFHGFIKNVWAVWADQKITIEEFQILTSRYYQDLMIYLKGKDKVANIGNNLSEMGKCIDKPEAVGNLRQQIVSIINELSKELELGGEVDTKIMDEHDRILFPLKFKNSILESLNAKLPVNNILEKGKFEFFREGPYNPEYVTFNFINYTGCKMILGPFNGTKIKFALVVDSKYHQVDKFRCKNTYNQRIDMGDVILGSPINFSDEKNMEIFRKEKRNDANTLINTLADNASSYFEEMKTNELSLSILKFLEQYIKE